MILDTKGANYFNLSMRCLKASIDIGTLKRSGTYNPAILNKAYEIIKNYEKSIEFDSETLGKDGFNTDTFLLYNNLVLHHFNEISKSSDVEEMILKRYKDLYTTRSTIEKILNDKEFSQDDLNIAREFFGKLSDYCSFLAKKNNEFFH